MKRRLFSAVAGISLVLCVATAIMWAILGNGPHWIAWLSGETRYAFFTSDAGVGFMVVAHWPYRRLWEPCVTFGGMPAVVLPLPTVILALSILPAKWLRQRLAANATPGLRDATTINFCICCAAGGLAALIGFIVVWLPLNGGEDAIAGTLGIAVPVLVVWFSMRKLIRCIRRPLPTGFCLVCGYDLRATPDRCPECGTPVPAGHKPTVI